MLGVGAFTAAFIALAPIACTIGSGAVTRCASGLGLRIPGGIVVGIACSFAIGMGSALLLRDWLRRTGRVHA